MSEIMILGTCSICGGPVTIPKFWNSQIPPVPSCNNCGATKKQPHYGAKIEMEPGTLVSGSENSSAERKDE